MERQVQVFPGSLVQNCSSVESVVNYSIQLHQTAASSLGFFVQLKLLSPVPTS